MRIFLKTDYQQDIRLFPFGGERLFFAGLGVYIFWLAAGGLFLPRSAMLIAAMIYAACFGVLLLRRNQEGEGGGGVFWHGLLGIALLSMPLAVDDYLLGQSIFVLVYAIAGVGLVLLSGWTGQISLGHAAFMASGAYTHALLQNEGFGILISLPAAALLSAALGVLVGLPALRVKGVYLAFATYAFAFIVEEVLARWESVTGGNHGLFLDFPEIVLPFWSWRFESDASFYYLALFLFGLCLLVALNILRTSTGRAFAAVRDSEIAAQSMGISLARVKTMAFAISAAMAGLAGALYGHILSTITPESFTIFLSINLLIIIVIGGLTSLHGAVFGSIFIVVLPQMLSSLRETLPAAIAEQTGLETMMFGLVIILFVLFEPMGIYGRWLKIKSYFDLFPLYRKGSFTRQRSYMVSERNR